MSPIMRQTVVPGAARAHGDERVPDGAPVGRVGVPGPGPDGHGAYGDGAPPGRRAGARHTRARPAAAGAAVQMLRHIIHVITRSWTPRWLTYMEFTSNDILRHVLHVVTRMWTPRSLRNMASASCDMASTMRASLGDGADREPAESCTDDGGPGLPRVRGTARGVRPRARAPLPRLRYGVGPAAILPATGHVTGCHLSQEPRGQGSKSVSGVNEEAGSVLWALARGARRGTWPPRSPRGGWTHW